MMISNRTLNARTGKRERRAVSSSVVALTPASYTIAGSSDGKRSDVKASGAILQVFGDAVLYTLDGTDPASGTGFEAAVGSTITLETAQMVKDFKAIRKTADATVEALYLF
jgi:hypothetical protein